MKKKGFTLIELLAVIIILAVVALIATPIVLNVIDEARTSAAQSEANLVLKGINSYCEQVEMKKELGGLDEGDFDCNPEENSTITLTSEEGSDKLSKMLSNLDPSTKITVRLFDGKVSALTVESKTKEVILDPATGKMVLQGEPEIEEPEIEWVTPGKECFTFNTDFSDYEPPLYEITGYTCDYENIIIPETIDGHEIYLYSLNSEKVIMLKNVRQGPSSAEYGYVNLGTPNLTTIVNENGWNMEWASYFAISSSDAKTFQYGKVIIEVGKEFGQVIEIVGPNGEKGDTVDVYAPISVDNITYQLNSAHDGLDIIGHSGATGDVVIPSTIYGLNVTGIKMERGSFYGIPATSITLPETLTSIGSDEPCFAEASNLTRIVNTAGATTNWMFLLEPAGYENAPSFAYGRVVLSSGRVVDIVGANGQTGNTYNVSDYQIEV